MRWTLHIFWGVNDYTETTSYRIVPNKASQISRVPDEKLGKINECDVFRGSEKIRKISM